MHMLTGWGVCLLCGCSQGHRDNILSCSLDRVGTSTAYDVNGRAYYVQDFGCSNSNKCKC